MAFLTGSGLGDWIHYALRMVHLIAGIMWIGNSFYFMWLDGHLILPEPKRDGVESELWMVHSGGFYRVERRKIEVGSFPAILHWFKWEATFTWISGFCLLIWLYYLQASLALVRPENGFLGAGRAVLLSLSVLAGSWFLYDFFWRSSCVKKNPKMGSLVSVGFAWCLIALLCRWFPGKAAYIHLGAVFGTLMVLNVWVHILPAQQKMIDATREGRQPDYALSKAAKLRSTHNTYMTLPVLFVMLSNHFPGIYGSEHNAVLLGCLVVLGALIRYWMLKGARAPAWVIAGVIAALAALLYLGAPRNHQGPHETVSFAEVKRIVSLRCIACHATHPVDATFGPSPGGVSFEDPAQIQKRADRILLRAVTTRTMPFGNKTGITDTEREELGAWVAQGAKGE